MCESPLRDHQRLARQNLASSAGVYFRGGIGVIRLAFFSVLSLFVLPAFASTRVTVAELERTLAADQGKPDTEIANHLSDLELTERLSATTLHQLESVSSGIRTAQALRILADESAFLSLPAAEIPAIPTPDVPAQRQIMALVVSYVSKTRPWRLSQTRSVLFERLGSLRM